MCGLWTNHLKGRLLCTTSLCRMSGPSVSRKPSNMQIFAKHAWNGPVVIVLYSHIPSTALLQRLFGASSDTKRFQSPPQGKRCISPQHIIKPKPPSLCEVAEFLFLIKEDLTRTSSWRSLFSAFLPLSNLFVCFFFLCVCVFFESWLCD